MAEPVIIEQPEHRHVIDSHAMYTIDLKLAIVVRSHGPVSRRNISGAFGRAGIRGDAPPLPAHWGVLRKSCWLRQCGALSLASAVVQSHVEPSWEWHGYNKWLLWFNSTNHSMAT